MSMDINMYNPFIVPFAFGVIVLFINLFIAFVSWIYHLDKQQSKHVLKNIISFKTIAAIWETLRECIFHRNIFKRNPVLGYMHLCFAFGWLALIVVGKMEAVAYVGEYWTNPWLAIFLRFFEDGRAFPHKEVYAFVMDLLLTFVLSGLLLALIKRVYSQLLGMKKTTKHTPSDRIALISLWCIFPLRLLAESATAAIKHNGGFLTQSLGNLLANLPIEHFVLPLWWAYSIALCLFFIFMPFTRYMHIFSEVLLVFFRKWGVTESEKKTGYTDMEINACSRCGICIDVCQLNTAANFNNVQSVYFIRNAREMVNNTKVINNCLMCNRCVDACPVGIKTTLVRQLFREKDGFNKTNYYDYLNTLSSDNKSKKYSIAYFAGCMSHLTPSIINSMKTIFDKAGENYCFIDEDKNLCCGKPLRQQGFLTQAEALKKHVTEIINQTDADFLVTSCPICYNSFVNEYNELKMPVLHHTQYIDMITTNGKIVLEKKNLSMVYHDPCEISRGCNIYEEPRNVLRKTGNLFSTENEKNDTLCCGGSIADTAIEGTDIEAIAKNTFATLTKSNPDILVTACPLCKKTFMRNNAACVKDISEIVVDSLNID